MNLDWSQPGNKPKCEDVLTHEEVAGNVWGSRPYCVVDKQH